MADVRSGKVGSLSLLSRDGLLCVAIFCVCILLIWPAAEVGINDDWVYTITAHDFARTGHFMFHGWASPMLGWQAIWGALFAKVFGPTYTAVRLSTAPVAAFSILLYHAILRRFGLNPTHATFGTLVLALGPIFLSLSTSFMTDVPAMLPILLCFYLCQLAVVASSDTRAVLWIAAAALSNIALGTVRQIAWLGVLVMIPSCVWLLRRRRYVPVVGAVLWITAVICIHFITNWFNHQPYTAPEKLIAGPVEMRMIGFVATEAARFVMTILLLLLPALTMALPSMWTLRRRAAIQLAAVLIPAALLLGLFHHRGHAFMIDSPWLGNTFTLYGVMRDSFFRSDRSIPPVARAILFFSVVICTFAAFKAFELYRERTLPDPVPREQAISWADMSILLLPFLGTYLLLLAPRSLFFYLFDRYLLEIIAILLIYLLRWHQEHMSLRIPTISVAVLVLLSSLVVADLHDLFSMYRAEVRLAEELENAGVPRTEMRGGFAFDFETQARAWGYVNDPRIMSPPNAYHPVPQPAAIMRDGVNCANPFERYLPALHVRYVFSADPSPCLAPTSFAPQPYSTWLPSARHSIFAGTPLPANSPTHLP